MSLSSIQPAVTPADVPLDRLAANPHLSEEQKVGELSRQFEALLLRQILSESQKTVFKSKFTDDSAVSSIYRDMVTERLADAMSRSGSLGLASGLKEQLARQVHEESP